MSVGITPKTSASMPNLVPLWDRYMVARTQGCESFAFSTNHKAFVISSEAAHPINNVLFNRSREQFLNTIFLLCASRNLVFHFGSSLFFLSVSESLCSISYLPYTYCCLGRNANKHFALATMNMFLKTVLALCALSSPVFGRPPTRPKVDPPSKHFHESSWVAIWWSYPLQFSDWFVNIALIRITMADLQASRYHMTNSVCTSHLLYKLIYQLWTI